MDPFADRLEKEIEKGLPGTETQWEMASSDRLVKDFPRSPRKDSAEAAVLILLYRYNGSIHTVFMQRPQYNGVHGGQISFPGGKMEDPDISLRDTALRETQEETGIDPVTIKIIGVLTPLFIPVSNIIVTPYVGWSDSLPEFHPEHKEVVYLINASLTPFLDNSILSQKPFEIRGEKINIRYFDYDGHVIWGATAMMLHELMVIMKRANMSSEV